jgi:hypothetical protein
MNSLKKKKPITIVFHTPFKSSFKDKVMHVYVWKVGWWGRGRYMHDVVPLADTSLFFLRLTKNTFFPCSFMKMVKPQYIN